MAEACDPFYWALAEYLTSSTGLTCAIVDEPDWRQRDRLLDCGEAEIGFVCGLQYLAKRDFELLAAPVSSGTRYRNKPIYFSDLVVASESTYQSFTDAEGAILAFNEPTSHSGCNLIRYHLAVRGLSAGYFGNIVESGSHRASIEMLLDRRADVAAIDATVLELETLARPELARKLRVIETLGPSPAPPAIVSKRVPRPIKERLRNRLITMHEDPAAKRVLRLARLSRFASVLDVDYEPIRSMKAKAGEIAFP